MSLTTRSDSSPPAYVELDQPEDNEEDVDGEQPQNGDDDQSQINDMLGAKKSKERRGCFFFSELGFGRVIGAP
jgi:hypothetical protein